MPKSANKRKYQALAASQQQQLLATATTNNALATSSSGVAPIVPLDPYRILPGGLKKPFLTYSAQNPPPPTTTVQSLLSLSPIAYSSRLAEKAVILANNTRNSASGGGSLKGKEKAVEGDQSTHAEDVKKWKEAQLGKGKKRRNVGVMSKKEAKMKGVWNVQGGDKINYDLLIPLHYLYLSYISEILNLPSYTPPSTANPSNPIETSSDGRIPSGEFVTSKIVKADFTGARILVKLAKNPCLIGIEGIVVQETCETFKLVTENSVLKVIPKKNSLFTLSFPAYSLSSIQSSLTQPESGDSEDSPTSPTPETLTTLLPQIPHISMDILGSSFAFRGEERARRRFKPGSGNGVGGGGGGWAEDWVGEL